MLLTIQNIQKYFGAELCLRNISCVLDAQDRAGIIGENGAGKTTLIKIITGELYPDDGIVTLAHGATIGYLEQNSVLDPACTVYGEMENASSMRRRQKMAVQNKTARTSSPMMLYANMKKKISLLGM